MPISAESSRASVSRCATARRRLGRHRPHAPRRCALAKSISSRKSRATTVSIGSRRRSRALTAAPPPIDPRITRARAAARAHDRRRASPRRSRLDSRRRPAAAPFASGRATRPDRQPVVRELRRAAAVAPSRARGICGRAQSPARAARRAVVRDRHPLHETDAARRQALAFAWTGAGRPHHWSERTRDVDFFDVEGLVSAVADGLDATVLFKPLTAPPAWLVAGQAAEVCASGKDSPAASATASAWLAG